MAGGYSTTAGRCEVNARYHLRENRVAFPGAGAHCVICSFHLPACAVLIKACNSWYLQKQSAATLICFIPSCIYQQLQGMLSLHFYFCTGKFSSIKLKKSAHYCLPKSHIFPFTEHILLKVLQSGIKVLRVIFHPMLPSKNKPHTQRSQSCIWLTKRTQSWSENVNRGAETPSPSPVHNTKHVLNRALAIVKLQNCPQKWLDRFLLGSLLGFAQQETRTRFCIVICRSIYGKGTAGIELLW